ILCVGGTRSARPNGSTLVTGASITFQGVKTSALSYKVVSPGAGSAGSQGALVCALCCPRRGRTFGVCSPSWPSKSSLASTALGDLCSSRQAPPAATQRHQVLSGGSAWDDRIGAADQAALRVPV
ncbi:Hypothetical predicted protein, partial [Marmota monax]